MEPNQPEQSALRKEESQRKKALPLTIQGDYCGLVGRRPTQGMGASSSWKSCPTNQQPSLNQLVKEMDGVD